MRPRSANERARALRRRQGADRRNGRITTSGDGSRGGGGCWRRRAVATTMGSGPRPRSPVTTGTPTFAVRSSRPGAVTSRVVGGAACWRPDLLYALYRAHVRLVLHGVREVFLCDRTRAHPQKQVSDPSTLTICIVHCPKTTWARCVRARRLDQRTRPSCTRICSSENPAAEKATGHGVAVEVAGDATDENGLA